MEAQVHEIDRKEEKLDGERSKELDQFFSTSKSWWIICATIVGVILVLIVWNKVKSEYAG